MGTAAANSRGAGPRPVAGDRARTGGGRARPATQDVSYFIGGHAMKITDIKTFLVHPGRGKNWLLVKVDTDEGLFGWGECYTQADRDRAIEVHVHAMKRYLIGRSPFDIK